LRYAAFVILFRAASVSPCYPHPYSGGISTSMAPIAQLPITVIARLLLHPGRVDARSRSTAHADSQ
jgi:hypothetical protein